MFKGRGIHLLNSILSRFQLEVINTDISYTKKFDPSSSYMRDASFHRMLIKELGGAAEAHFSSRLKHIGSDISYDETVKDFFEIYSKRPIKDNTGGSGFHNAFWLFVTARAVNPSLIVESGVHKGHTTYLLSKACPDAKILGFDINLSRLQYKNISASYYEHDWASYHFDHIDPERSLVFFDCHVNHALRIRQAHKNGFRHLVFDDNPPAYKLYGYGLPGFPTASMVWNAPSLKDFPKIEWMWRGKQISYPVDMNELNDTRTLMKAHEPYPDVGASTRYGGFSFLSYVNL